MYISYIFRYDVLCMIYAVQLQPKKQQVLLVGHIQSIRVSSDLEDTENETGSDYFRVQTLQARVSLISSCGSKLDCQQICLPIICTHL